MYPIIYIVSFSLLSIVDIISFGLLSKVNVVRIIILAYVIRVDGWARIIYDPL